MDINLTVKLMERAWSLRILALMGRGVLGRQAVLLAESGAGRTAFGHSLEHLVDLGLLARNPGHGHPLRPEYILTPLGQANAPAAMRIDAIAGRAGGSTVLRRVWSLPVLAVSQSPRHFSEIKSGLGGQITDRALSTSLKQLQGQHWLRREVGPGYPPRPVYQAVDIGAEIGAIVLSG